MGRLWDRYSPMHWAYQTPCSKEIQGNRSESTHKMYSDGNTVKSPGKHWRAGMLFCSLAEHWQVLWHCTCGEATPLPQAGFKICLPGFPQRPALHHPARAVHLMLCRLLDSPPLSEKSPGISSQTCSVNMLRLIYSFLPDWLVWNERQITKPQAFYW